MAWADARCCWSVLNEIVRFPLFGQPGFEIIVCEKLAVSSLSKFYQVVSHFVCGDFTKNGLRSRRRRRADFHGRVDLKKIKILMKERDFGSKKHTKNENK